MSYIRGFTCYLTPTKVALGWTIGPSWTTTAAYYCFFSSSIYFLFCFFGYLSFDFDFDLDTAAAGTLFLLLLLLCLDTDLFIYLYFVLY